MRQSQKSKTASRAQGFSIKKALVGAIQLAMLAATAAFIHQNYYPVSVGNYFH
jgi:hypothetical protein